MVFEIIIQPFFSAASVFLCGVRLITFDSSVVRNNFRSGVWLSMSYGSLTPTIMAKYSKLYIQKISLFFPENGSQIPCQAYPKMVPLPVTRKIDADTLTY